MLVKRETKNPLVIHMGLVLAEAICFSAFYVEIRRAMGGNRLSWAYVFEWPIFAGYAVYVWKKLLSDERRESSQRVASESSTPRDEPDDSLAAYNEYLRSVHDDDRHGDTAPSP